MGVDPYECWHMAIAAGMQLDLSAGEGLSRGLIALKLCEHPRRQRAGETPLCAADVLYACHLFEAWNDPRRRSSVEKRT